MKLLLLLLSTSIVFSSRFSPCFSQKKRNALAAYVNRADPSYKWQNYKATETKEGNFYELEFISQTWHNLKWSHRLIIYLPAKAKPLNTLLLVLRHLYNRNADLPALKIISDSTNTASAILYDIPNQPLFDGKEEDDLQAYTFARYIESGDESWPLLFPMVKGVVRALDAIQQVAIKEKKTPINNFIITGHSKRGHTSWLTASVDSRVKGIIPIAIDILNSPAQLPHHLEVFGEYSTPSKTTSDLLPGLNQPRGKRLIEMVDAYSYRAQLLLPKLIVSATNDPFFSCDALNLYWPGLKGPKPILYLSNANHISAYSDPRVNSTAFAFVRAVATGKKLPQFSWEYSENKKIVTLKIIVGSEATAARTWSSRSQNKDFRQSGWVSNPMQEMKKGIQAAMQKEQFSRSFESALALPDKGFIAVFGEIDFIQGGSKYILSTQMYMSRGNE